MAVFNITLDTDSQIIEIKKGDETIENVERLEIYKSGCCCYEEDCCCQKWSICINSKYENEDESYVWTNITANEKKNFAKKLFG